MSSEPTAITGAYLEHFTPEDLVLLSQADPEAAGGPGDARALLSRYPGGFDELLTRPEAFDAVFAPSGERDPLLAGSPFLVFAVCVHRAAAELESVAYVPEWLGPGRRAPVFDVDQLRDFVSGSWRRLFLIELLASYTHVSSGSVVISTRRGLRRQRFSELDPVRLAGLLEVVTEAERPGILRRLGDLALFLTGVFPDHVGRRGFGPIEEGRLLRAGGVTDGRAESLLAERSSGGPGDGGAVGLLEQLGRRWYRVAFDRLPRPVPGNVAVLGELPERFGQARRILGVVTERFLFPHRDRWFGLADG